MKLIPTVKVKQELSWQKIHYLFRNTAVCLFAKITQKYNYYEHFHKFPSLKVTSSKDINNKSYLTNFQNYAIDMQQDTKIRADEIYLRRIPLTFQVRIPLQSYHDQVQCICAHCKSASVCSHTLSNSRNNPRNDKMPTGEDNFPPAQVSGFANDFLKLISQNLQIKHQLVFSTAQKPFSLLKFS